MARHRATDRAGRRAGPGTNVNRQLVATSNHEYELRHSDRHEPAIHATFGSARLAGRRRPNPYSPATTNGGTAWLFPRHSPDHHYVAGCRQNRPRLTTAISPRLFLLSPVSKITTCFRPTACAARRADDRHGTGESTPLFIQPVITLGGRRPLGHYPGCSFNDRLARAFYRIRRG